MLLQASPEAVALWQCFLTFFGFVHPCNRLLHSHSPDYGYMADVS